MQRQAKRLEKAQKDLEEIKKKSGAREAKKYIILPEEVQPFNPEQIRRGRGYQQISLLEEEIKADSDFTQKSIHSFKDTGTSRAELPLQGRSSILPDFTMKQ